MENLLSAISSEENPSTGERLIDIRNSHILDRLNIRRDHSFSFFQKVFSFFSASLFVGRKSGWNVRRLKYGKAKSKVSFLTATFSAEETERIKKRMEDQIQTGALAFYLGASMVTLHEMQSMLEGSEKKYFVAVPVERRPAAMKDSLLGNYISFLYFQASSSDLISVKDAATSISKLTIVQARKKMPEKFLALLEVFRFIPAAIYRTFINMPTHGHAGTFAFSMLANSKLESKKFMGYVVKDVTHFAPVISPPGLAVVITEFRKRLKITLSFDVKRISVEDASAYLQRLKSNLL